MQGEFGELGSPEIKVVEEIFGDRTTGLDLDTNQSPRGNFDQGINLVTFLIAKKMELRTETSVKTCLQKLGDGPVLEKCTSKRMGIQMRRLADTNQPGSEAGITEIKFRALDEAFGEIGKPRTYEVDQVTGLQHREPRIRGQAIDSGIRRQGGDIDKLADPACAKRHEALESG